jgi:glycosyltransferase involved in cell wall biosynthesis
MAIMQVSVIMPVYNAKCYVGASIESILAQTFAGFEFIIVVDGSTDGSLAVVQRYAARDQRVRVISRPNTGIVGALNDGLVAAHGKYIARMDADDLCEPNRLELQLRRLEAEPDLVALGSCAIAIDPDGELLGDAPVPLTHEEIEAQHLRGISSIYHPAVMMRTEALRRVGGYREGTCPCEDYDLWLRLGEVGRLANLPERLFIWRRTSNGIVASKATLMREAITRVLNEAKQRRGIATETVIAPVKIKSTCDRFREWGWVALRHGRVATARKYARRSIAEEPLSPASWRLAACALRGY